jgi:ATP-dependent protease HslVU (ClpYQ) peptidase subunit
MTCIVGITNGYQVYLGGERAASDGIGILSMASPKVHKRGDWVYGYAGTIGIGQLLDLTPLPEIGEDDDIFFLIRTVVVEELKSIITKYSEEQTEKDTGWLIGARGRLFEVNHSDWSVIEVYESSIGSGSTYALGSIYTSMSNESIRNRIELALQAAITYAPTCQGPYDIVFTENGGF